MVVMVTVHSNQVVAGGNPVAHWLVPAVQIRGHFTVAVNVPVQMTTAEAKPSDGKILFSLKRWRKGLPRLLLRPRKDFPFGE